MNHFVIREQLPSLNKVIDANRNNRYSGAHLKKKVQEEIGWYIRSALSKGDLKPVQKRVTISITWHEKTKRRDVDNIQSAKKFILDAMVEQGILIDDKRKYVAQIYDTVVDDKEDYVEVYLNECD